MYFQLQDEITDTTEFVHINWQTVIPTFEYLQAQVDKLRETIDALTVNITVKTGYTTYPEDGEFYIVITKDYLDLYSSQLPLLGITNISITDRNIGAEIGWKWEK